MAGMPHLLPLNISSLAQGSRWMRPRHPLTGHKIKYIQQHQRVSISIPFALTVAPSYQTPITIIIIISWDSGININEQTNKLKHLKQEHWNLVPCCLNHRLLKCRHIIVLFGFIIAMASGPMKSKSTHSVQVMQNYSVGVSRIFFLSAANSLICPTTRCHQLSTGHAKQSPNRSCKAAQISSIASFWLITLLFSTLFLDHLNT